MSKASGILVSADRWFWVSYDILILVQLCYKNSKCLLVGLFLDQQWRGGEQREGGLIGPMTSSHSDITLSISYRPHRVFWTALRRYSDHMELFFSDHMEWLRIVANVSIPIFFMKYTWIFLYCKMCKLYFYFEI